MSDVLRIEKEEKEKIKEKTVETPFVELSDGTLCEEGYNGEEVYFICYNPSTGKIRKEKRVEDQGKIYVPIFNDHVKNGLVFLPSEAVDYESEEKLIDETRDFLNRWHEQLNVVDREFDVNYVRMTWIYDVLPEVCYRRIIARMGKSKTAFLTTIGAICYRGFILSGADTEAAIRRLFDTWRGTAIIDEADFSRSDLYAVIIKILNIGWSSRFGWHEKADENDPKKVILSRVFGPKILATRKRFTDVATESRCQTCYGMENVGEIPLFRHKKFEKEALELRNKYLMWRFKNYHKLKRLIEEKIEDKKIFEEAAGEKLLDVRSRIKQVITPLLLIAQNSKVKKILVDSAKAFEVELKQLDPTEGFKSEIEASLRDLLEESASESGDASDAIGVPGIAKIELKKLALKIAPSLIQQKPKLAGFCRRISNFLRQEYPNLIAIKEEGHENVKYIYLSDVLVKKLGDTNSNTRNAASTRIKDEETEKAMTCWLCLKLLDLKNDKWIQNNATNNLPVHLDCYQKLKEGVKENAES
jgi:hypothetical protein